MARIRRYFSFADRKRRGRIYGASQSLFLCHRRAFDVAVDLLLAFKRHATPVGVAQVAEFVLGDFGLVASAAIATQADCHMEIRRFLIGQNTDFSGKSVYLENLRPL